MKNLKRLSKKFYEQDLILLALNLLNKIIVIKKNDQILKYKIVETEAYSFYEKGAHCYQNKITKRNKSMFLTAGHLYVYLIYGLYHCLNIVAGPLNQGEAVLIRALEPLSNHQTKTNGPGLLAKTLEITKKEYDGLNLKNSQNFYLASFNQKENDHYQLIVKNQNYLIYQAKNQKDQIIATKRIGIDYAKEDKDLLWRFYLKNNQFVSKKIKLI